MPEGIARICNDATGAKTRFYVAMRVTHCTSLQASLGSAHKAVMRAAVHFFLLLLLLFEAALEAALLALDLALAALPLFSFLTWLEVLASAVDAVKGVKPALTMAMAAAAAMESSLLMGFPVDEVKEGETHFALTS